MHSARVPDARVARAPAARSGQVMLEVALLLALAAGIWLLWDSLKAREAANRAIRGACQAHGYLFLDDTVALAKLRPGRDAGGRFSMRRIYRFEFSDNGHQRRPGAIAMLGDQVERVEVEPPVTADALSSNAS